METKENTEWLIKDNHSKWVWKTKEGQLIPLSEMADSHLRNAALFLMGFGFQECIANNERRIVWLRVMRKEWERRQLKRRFTFNEEEKHELKRS